jgi:predicted SAM-dependent methyltransferase
MTGPLERSPPAPAGAPLTLKRRLGRWLTRLLGLSPDLVFALRFEANCRWCRWRNALSPAYRRKVAALRAQRGLSLNVGSGGRGLPGWLNTDAVGHPSDQTFPCDVRRGIPLTDGSVARILAEHVVEHLNFRHELPSVLREFRRVLQPGGRLRIIVPDGRRFAEAYVRDDPAAWAALGLEPFPADMPTPMAMLNHVFHQGGEHHFAYDFETLAWALRAAGFAGVERSAFGASGDPALAIDRQEHAPYSLYVEAVKP